MVKTTRYMALHTKCSSMDGMDGPGPRDVHGKNHTLCGLTYKM